MKKILLLVFSFVVVSLGINAQRVRKLGFSVNAGVSSSKLTGGEFDSKTGFVGGVAATFSLGKNFYLQPEVNFQQQGAKFKNDIVIGDIITPNAELKLNYLNVPVLLKYKFAPTHLSIYAGPQAGFKLSSKFKVPDSESSKYDAIKSMDFGGVYGLEYFFPIDANSAIVLNARYKTGFTNVLKDNAYFVDNNKAKINSFSFTVGYRF